MAINPFLAWLGNREMEGMALFGELKVGRSGLCRELA